MAAKRTKQVNRKLRSLLTEHKRQFCLARVRIAYLSVSSPGVEAAYIDGLLELVGAEKEDITHDVIMGRQRTT